MIYQLNNETHFDLSSELMTELVMVVNHRILNRPPLMSDRLLIELCNFRGALANELDRIPVRGVSVTVSTSGCDPGSVGSNPTPHTSADPNADLTS
jgi:hypothetical protein